MGLFLRTNLFHGVSHEQVYAALEEFWRQEQHQLQDVEGLDGERYDLHEARNGWTMLNWTPGWEWDLRRRAQLHVSRVYDCPGLLTFVYDGDLWGYELFHHGMAVDHHLQWRDTGLGFFGDLPCQGRPDVLVAQFPELALDVDDARSYLTSISIDDPAYEDFDWDEHDPRNRPVRDGDAAGRLQAEVVFDFWRFLGAPPRGTTPVWRKFTTEPL